MATVGKPFRFVADDSVFRTPLFGLYLHLAGCLRVGRTRGRARLQYWSGSRRPWRPVIPCLSSRKAASTAAAVRSTSAVSISALRRWPRPAVSLSACAPCWVRNGYRRGCWKGSPSAVVYIGRTQFFITPAALADKTGLRNRIASRHQRSFRALGHALSGQLAPDARSWIPSGICFRPLPGKPASSGPRIPAAYLRTWRSSAAATATTTCF